MKNDQKVTNDMTKMMLYIPKKLKAEFRAKVHAHDENMSVVFRRLVQAYVDGKIA